MNKEKLSKLRHEGHITDAEYREMIRLCDRDQELIRKFRELQQTALKKGYTQSGGYYRGVTDCLRVVLDEYEVPDAAAGQSMSTQIGKNDGTRTLFPV